MQRASLPRRWFRQEGKDSTGNGKCPLQLRAAGALLPSETGKPETHPVYSGNNEPRLPGVTSQCPAGAPRRFPCPRIQRPPGSPAAGWALGCPRDGDTMIAPDPFGAPSPWPQGRGDAVDFPTPPTAAGPGWGGGVRGCLGGPGHGASQDPRALVLPRAEATCLLHPRRVMGFAVQHLIQARGKGFRGASAGGNLAAPPQPRPAKRPVGAGTWRWGPGSALLPRAGLCRPFPFPDPVHASSPGWTCNPCAARAPSRAGALPTCPAP